MVLRDGFRAVFSPSAHHSAAGASLNFVSPNGSTFVAPQPLRRASFKMAKISLRDHGNELNPRQILPGLPAIEPSAFVETFSFEQSHFHFAQRARLQTHQCWPTS